MSAGCVCVCVCVCGGGGYIAEKAKVKGNSSFCWSTITAVRRFSVCFPTKTCSDSSVLVLASRDQQALGWLRT